MTGRLHFDYAPGKQGLYDPAFEKDACGVGFIADMTGAQTHATVKDATLILTHLTHRGACGCEAETGDGAGMLLAIPDKLYRKVCNFELPDFGRYSAGIVFFPKDEALIAKHKKIIEDSVAAAGQKFIGWRLLPVRPNFGKGLGATSRACEPHMEQMFVGAADSVDQKAFEPILFAIRKKAQIACDKECPEDSVFYICSLSSRVITYKGMLTAHQLSDYFEDLVDEDCLSHIALVHSRFATNTFPGWKRAHPYRYMCHNGEINTVCGNKNWQSAREGVMSSPNIPNFETFCPIIEKGGSDSTSFDNVLELLIMGGRTLPEACLMMMPEAWQNSEVMSEERKDYYKFHSSIMEPWDGPALVAFSDGLFFGATLDRNGLRPCRYYVTKEGRVIGGSEVGVLHIDDDSVVQKGRLEPGKMFLIDFAQKRMISDEEYKSGLVTKHPYGQWLRDGVITMDKLLLSAPPPTPVDPAMHTKLMRNFGFTTETLEMLILPMAGTGQEGLGSMGNDVPLACLSTRSRTMFEYFKQLFAQVTNPPIDPIRESVVMTLECFVGPERNILSESSEHVKRLYLKHPVLTDQELAAIRASGDSGCLKAITIDATFALSEGEGGLKAAIDRICKEASAAAKDGVAYVILSDKAVSEKRVAIPALLASGAVHHHLVQSHQRTRVALISESGEPREVHHFCLMTGYGADAVNPYMVYVAIDHLIADGELTVDRKSAIYSYNKAAGKGMLKVMAKMGVSTLQSYKGAQVFECVGLGAEVVDMCLRGTSSRIGGLSFVDVARDAIRQHSVGFFPRENTEISLEGLENPGEYMYRANPGSEAHINDPSAIAALQDASRTNSRAAFAAFSKHHHAAVERCTLRGQLVFSFDKATPISIDEVEPASEIVKRFRTGAMSYGSISMESHAALAVAMNSVGAKSNTGEGGEAPERFEKKKDGSNMRSSIKQVASGRFGVTINYLTNADELQIKMAQGAKPGEGGELPGNKVNETIARCRNSTIGVGLISPPPHHDIYSIEDLAQLIFDLKNCNRAADVSVKLVSEVGVGVVAAGVAKAKADHILISGHDGGTGASRWTGIKHAGLPFELGIAETHQTLVLNGLRGRVSLETDGCLRNGHDVAIACALGAEMFGFATAPLIAMGCIMMRKCHLNTCPVGIATQDPELRAKFAGTPEHVVNYLFLVAEECREIMAKLGVKSIPELVGRCELIHVSERLKSNPKWAGLDLSALIQPAFMLKNSVLNEQDRDQWLTENHKIQPQDHGLDENVGEGTRAVDHHVIAAIIAACGGKSYQCKGTHPFSHTITSAKLLGASAFNPKDFPEALKGLRSNGGKVEIEMTVNNLNRSMCTILSNEVAKVVGEDATPFGTNPTKDETFSLKVKGSAGQSFGAFMAKGVSLELVGDTNDYCGKGLCGGTICVFPPAGSNFKAEENIIVGNVCLYGATGGNMFVRGVAAERFCVRNSGACAVVEGTGDHGCEYMTGGRVVVLGKTGINFAAGMSGGRAYVYDTDSCFLSRASHEEDPGKEYGPVYPEYEAELKGLIQQHKDRTGSAVAEVILGNWAAELKKFVQVFPVDFKAALAKEKKGASAEGVDHLTPSEKEAMNIDPAPDATVKAVDLEDMVQRPIKVDKPLKKRGFIEYERGAAPYRAAEERIKDFNEIYTPIDEGRLKTQGARCMNCGVPFCHQKETGCPLGNKIPEWNDLVYQGKWKQALERLTMTNNFPEFTGRVCPAPCEGACVLGIIEQPVTIKNIECAIIDRAFEQGWIVPRPPTTRTGKKVAIIGSGPAGMAAADQLNKAGHLVTVFERADRIGGLMMYGVPNMKADKNLIVQRRVDLMAAEGIIFKTGSAGNIGGAKHPLQERFISGSEAAPSAKDLVAQFDSVLVSTGATMARDLTCEGREFKGVHLAMEFLHGNTKSILDSGATGTNWLTANNRERIDAKGKKVVVIGGGDTGNDCIGTSVRHGAISVVNFEILPQPTPDRAEGNPWPQWPRIYRVDYGHSESEKSFGKDPREFLITTKRFVGDADGNLTGVETVRVEWAKNDAGAFIPKEVPGSEHTFDCDLAFLAMGFLGPEKTIIDELALAQDPRGNIKAEFGEHVTSVGKVFAAGDCRRGQSLVVWAIREGREAAREIDTFLMGSSALP